MRTSRIAGSLLLVTVLAGCSAGAPEASPEGVALGFEVLENRAEGGFAASLTIDNLGPETLGTEGWTLYFSFARRVRAESIEGGVEITHLNGDFYRLSPTPEFEPLAPGTESTIRFEGSGRLLRHTDAPAGPYFVFDGEEGPQVVPPVDYAMAPWPAWAGGGAGAPAMAPTAASRFERESRSRPLEAAELPPLVPTPVTAIRGEGRLTLDASWEIAATPGLEREARHLAAALGSLLGSDPAIVDRRERSGGAIVLELGEIEVAGEPRSDGDEAYRLTAEPGGDIEIVGSDPAGVFYGIQSLLALLPVEAYDGGAEELEIDAIRLADAPRFGYRGLHLDVSRNFQTRATVEKLLGVMAFYKLNRFHFHLADDEGWRLAIGGLAELTEVGARRGHTLTDDEHLVPSFGSGPDPDAADNHGSGHYTREDFVALLRYAAERHIEVVPEIDLPGHARAAIRAMEARAASPDRWGRPGEAGAFLLSHPEDRSEYRSVQGWNDNVIDVCLPSTYRFLETVVEDLVAMYEVAGAPLTTIHVGGDEVPHGVWEKSPACAKLIAEDPALSSTEDLAGYFLDRVSTMLYDRGLVTGGWEEIALTEVRHGSGAAKSPNPAFVERRFRPYVWNNVWGWGAEDLGYRLANAGYEIVLANATNLYFDLAYDRDPREPGYTWAGTVDTRKAFDFTPLDVFRSAEENSLGHPIDGEALYADRERPSAEGRSRILGIQGQLWGENSKGREAMEYLALPKTIALAERAWAAQPAWAREADPATRRQLRETDWNRFANAVGQRELPRLDAMAGGFAYRLPPPGAVIEDGKLHANVRFPGLTIRFTTDGSEPTADSLAYEGPVEVSGTVRLRSFDGRERGSLTTTVEP